MKKVILAINLILLVAMVTLAQEKKNRQDPNEVDEKPAVPQQKQTKKKDAAKAGSQTDATGKVLLESGSSLDAALQGTLDVRKSKVGDEVVLKTTESIKQDGEVVVPKGTKLIGRVTEVTRKSGDNKTSSLSMVFESIQNKSLSAPISATVVSITNARGNVQAGDLFGTDAIGSSRSSGTVSRGGGGLLGGATGAVGGVLNTTTDTLGGVTNTVGSTAGGATQTLGGTLSGIQLSQSADAAVSGSTTLTAQDKNIRLEKGTQFQLKLSESIQN